MARKNIFDILCSEIDINHEILTIESLCDEHLFTYSRGSYTLEEFVDEYCLVDWKNRNRCTTCEEIRDKLKISYSHIKKGLTGNQIFIYFEYIINLLYLCKQYLKENDFFFLSKSYNYLLENLAEIINYLNCETMTFEDEQKVLLVEKNSAVTAVTEIIEPELAYQVIEYNHYLLKGNIDKKQRILKTLADKIEPMRNQLKQINSSSVDNAFYLLNKMNIRHNNLEGKNAIPYVQNLSKEELEEWYDETYQMILLCILEYDNIERNKKVTELKKIIETK